MAQELTISLSVELAQLVQDKVRSGQYASESDVVREGLLALQARDIDLMDWLHDDVGPTYDAYIADPGRAKPLMEVRARIAGSMAEGRKKAS